MGCALQQLGANGCGGKLLQYRRAVGLTPRPAGNFLQSWTPRGRGVFFARGRARAAYQRFWMPRRTLRFSTTRGTQALMSCTVDRIDDNVDPGSQPARKRPKQSRSPFFARSLTASA